jgi:predicted O-methyltransferase YrrM
MSKQVPGSVIIDLGSYYGLSAFAMGSELSNTIISFDIEDRESLIAGYNNLTGKKAASATIDPDLYS